MTILRHNESQRLRMHEIEEYADRDTVTFTQGANGHDVYCRYDHGGITAFKCIDTAGQLRTLMLNDVIDARD